MDHDLKIIKDEIVALRDVVQKHLVQSAKTETDLAWVKRAVLGAFSLMSAALAALWTRQT